MLLLTVANTLLLVYISYTVFKLKRTVFEMHGSMDGIKRLLIALFTKARKNKESEVS